MYSLLIVEDENEIREGLSCIHWEQMNMKLAGCATHGLDALQAISLHPVDIVLTDIRMPFMDGIELMSILQERHSYVRVVILSGYDDFEYAQKAIELGAVGYLLKPVRMEQLTETFAKLVRKLDEDKQNERRRSVLLRKEAVLSKLMREELLSRLFRAAVPEEDIEQACAESEMILESDEYQVSIIRLDRFPGNQPGAGSEVEPGSGRGPERNIKLVTFSLDNILDDLWDMNGLGYHLVDKVTAECYLLGKQTCSRESLTQLHEQLSKFMGLFRSTLSISTGQTVGHVRDIWRSAESARRLLQNTCDENVIVQDVDMHQANTIMHTTAAERANLGVRPDPAERTNLGVRPNQTERTNSNVRTHSEAAPENEGDKEPGDPFIVQKAKQYIQGNYHRSITLKEVAGQMFVTPGHLSWLFRESGESYLQYLTALRMSKAIELMADIRYKVYEIAEMVGYSDKTYFSELFKKHTGKTPTEYRGTLP